MCDSFMCKLGISRNMSEASLSIFTFFRNYDYKCLSPLFIRTRILSTFVLDDINGHDLKFVYLYIKM